MAKRSANRARNESTRRPRRRVPVATNDNLSEALTEYIPEDLRGTDRFLDIVNWNIRYFNRRDESRVRLITKIMGEINADIFVLQEIEEGSMDAVRDGLTASGAGLYETAYGRTGGQQRVAFLFDTEWVRFKDDFTELFADEPNRLPNSQKRIFPRLPFHNSFLGFSSEGNIDFHLVGVHLKAFMGESDDGVEQRRLSAERLAQWMTSETDDRDVVVCGDWNAKPSSREWKSLRDLEEEGHVRFHAWNNEDEGSHFYRSHLSRIDIVMVSDAIEKVAVTNEAKVIPWKGVFTSPAIRRELVAKISDHMPVVSRFYFRDLD